MSVQKPAYTIPRWSVVGMEGMWAKMFDPPKDSPVTPDLVVATNPVPEVMAAAGYQNTPAVPHTVQRDLMHGKKINAWDGKELVFFTFRDNDNPATAEGNWPGATIRVPRGVIFHCQTNGHGPPPHSIHWHGIEPTPMNDGVGHCSMEVGDYLYQWQPNFIGTYFYHCHRNTMQHFEFGLYGLLLIEPPDAYFATLKDPSIPVGHCRDGKRRTAANLSKFLQFPGFDSSLLTDSDPLGEFPTNPHAMTVPYDVEALWVFDDRDSVWSDLGSDPHATYPKVGAIPGVDDDFRRKPGVNGFFAFNDFNADYWFVTGEPVRARKGGIAAIPAGLTIPAPLNSGVTGSQISIEAKVGQTILIRCLNGAYNSTEVTFPVDVVIIAWDGRALGQPPYAHNEAYLVKANTPILMSTARRFDALIRVTTPVDSFATVKFINTRGQGIEGFNEVLVVAQIPIRIAADSGVSTFAASGRITDADGAALAGITVTAAPATRGASPLQTVATGADGTYTFEGLLPGDYDVTPSVPNMAFLPISRRITISDAGVPSVDFAGFSADGALEVILFSSPASPQTAGTGVTFTAQGQGGGGAYQYQFRLKGKVVQPFSADATWTWDTAEAAAGTHRIDVQVRSAASLKSPRASVNYVIQAGVATGVTLLADSLSPQPPGAAITFTASGEGGAGFYQYEFWLLSGPLFRKKVRVQRFSANDSWVWNTAGAAPGDYRVQVSVRGAGSKTARPQALAAVDFTLIP